MNNRVIKFRVWRKGVFEYVDLHPFRRYGPLVDWDRSQHATDEDDGTVHVAVSDHPHIDDCVWQQFTGILDKDGTEIYEGDIVNVNGKNRRIEWRGAGFAATGSDYNLNSVWFMGGEPKVVGNIFETPELEWKL